MVAKGNGLGNSGRLDMVPEVKRANKESTEGICVGIGIGRASVPKMAQAGLPNRGIGGILAMAWKLWCFLRKCLGTSSCG